MNHPTGTNRVPESPDTPLVSAIPDLWFELPPGFTEFDLAEDAEARMLRMAESVEAVFSSATPTQRFSLVVSGEYILQTMIAAGAEHISSCLLRMPEDELSQGTLCVIIERPDVGPQNQDRQGTARRTAAQWRELYPDAEIGLVMLPYGISALCIRDQRLDVPGAFFGLDAPLPSTVRQAQFCVPLRTGPGSALLVFMTEDLRHWTDHLEVFSLIMKSVSTDEPQTEQAPVAGRTEGPE
ncbi:hypothetical protein [Streptomyces fungicidicus]|uniref:Uncharacterized protein n=1 Tax=Streptomyces fungicidicus TaxID=68203 RepID=A0ACC7Y433_9ACTN|nr:hypothetical protein [Streptomyces fungicidicus]NUV76411.1 hypothetical protein [Streptomyces fungicidicus]